MSSSSTITGFAGFNSGLPIDDIITKMIDAESKPIQLMQQKQTTLTTQKNAYSNVKTKVQALLDSIRVLTKRDVVSGTTIFDGMLGTASDSTIATASATGTAAAQTINLEVKKLATATKATTQTAAGVGKFADASTTLSALGITAGSFTVFSNASGGTPTAHTVTITDPTTETLGSVLAQINGAVPEISNSAAIANGKISMNYTAGSTVTFGGGADTSNFLSVTHLLTAVNDSVAGTLTASQSNNLIDANATMSTAAANLNGAVADGTFTINGVSFDTTGKSLNQIITEINNNSSVNVTANYNTGTNKLELTSKTTGSTMISLTDGTSGFLTAMGLVVGGNGAASQTAGQNAEFVVNGTTMYSATNSADETTTGILGVTLTLNKEEPGSTTQITISRDTDSVTKAVQDVLDKYYDAVNYIDGQTNGKNGGVLAGESRLVRLRNQIRGLFTAQVGALASTSYDSLQRVGITTGAVGTYTSSSASPKLQLDTDKLKEALTASPDTVKKLFIGQNLLDGTVGDDNVDGTLTQIQNLLSDKIYKDSSGNDAFGELYDGGDAGRGLFAAYSASSDKRMDSLNDSIERAQDRLDKRQAMLRQQFLAMDQMVGQYKSQGDAITGLVNQLNANNK